MKIGILTYHCVPNFGAQLQTVSTIGYLKKMGHEPIVINWYPQDLEEMYAKRIPKEQVICHNKFTQTVFPITKICRTEEDIIEQINNEGINAVVVGSDALFKYTPLKNRIRFNKRKLRYESKKILSVEKLEGNPFFGGFVNKLNNIIPAVAFSISSQNCPFIDMNDEEISKMREAMGNYLSITVRDEWTKTMVERIMRKSDIRITPDPVFSFNQNCYFSLPDKEDILNRFKLHNNYVLISFSTWYSNKEYIHKIADEVSRRGIQPVAFPMPEKLFSANISASIPLPLSPIDWYSIIRYARGYIGERMHPIIVCLHNAVPFFCFDEYGIYRSSIFGLRKTYIKESSKTYHILSQAEMTEWMFSYYLKKRLPKPKYVVDKIMEFDKLKCQLFASKFQMQYEEAMNGIMDTLLL